MPIMKRVFIVFLLVCVLGAGLLFVLKRSPQSSSEGARNNRQSEAPLSVAFTRPLRSERPEGDTLEQELCHWLGQTQQQVDLAVFELELPCVEEVLKRLHQQKKQVRIVSDSDHLSPEIKRLKKLGIPVVDDQRGAFMHNKFLVRDDDSLWTGSMNLTPNGVHRNNNNVVRIRHAGVAQLYRAEFEEMFAGKFGPRSPRQKLPALFQLDGVEIEVLFSPEDPVQERIVDLLQGAQKSIHFMAFSFTDDKMGKAIQARAKAGVTVRGVFESMGSKSKYSEYGRLKRQKLDVKRDGSAGILHHKVFIIDEKTVVTGSYNFSKNADRSNDENVVILHSPPLAQAYLQELQSIYVQAK